MEPDINLPDATAMAWFWQQCPDLFALLGPDSELDVANDAWTATLGWDPEELHGRALTALVHPEDRSRVEAELAATAGPDPACVRFETRLATSDGDYRDMRCHAESTGPDAVMALVAHDITVQRQTEAEVLNTSVQLQLAMEHAPIPMALTDLAGHWTQVNHAMCELLGRDRGQLVGSVVEQITHPDDIETSHHQMQQLLAGGADHYTFEKRFVHTGGAVVSAQVTACLLRDADGHPHSVLVQIVDVTERNRTEAQLRSTVAELQDANQQLETANRSLEHFTTIASHDLRSPLATVHGLLETAIAHTGTSDADMADLGLLDRALQHTAGLLATVDSLLELSRIRNTTTLARRTVDLHLLLDELSDTLAAESDHTGATIERGPLPPVEGDPILLRVLLQNLLSNAIKFRHPDRPPVITIEVVEHPDVWVLTVTDNGRGFDPADAEVIFELFGRTTQGHQHQGAGIGLATCRQIAQQHGGTIHAHPLPQGARFVVTLPKHHP